MCFGGVSFTFCCGNQLNPPALTPRLHMPDCPNKNIIKSLVDQNSVLITTNINKPYMAWYKYCQPIGSLGKNLVGNREVSNMFWWDWNNLWCWETLQCWLGGWYRHIGLASGNNYWKGLSNIFKLIAPTFLTWSVDMSDYNLNGIWNDHKKR